MKKLSTKERLKQYYLANKKEILKKKKERYEKTKILKGKSKPWNKDLKIACNTGRTWFKKGHTPSHKGKLTDNGTRYQKPEGIIKHRKIMENHIGRRLTPKEIVHHKNKIKSDNRIQNLLLCPSQSFHQILHGRKKFFTWNPRYCNVLTTI